MTQHLQGSRRVLWTTVATLVALVTWASFASIDQFTRATGQVIASKHSQIVQSTEGGVLANLLVKEGTVVTKGQLLATLDQIRPKAFYQESRAKAMSFKAQVARLRAEVYGGQPKFTQDIHDYPEFIEGQQALFTKRQKAIREDIEALEKTLVLVKRELAMNQPLLANGDVSEADIIRLQRQVADVEAQIVSKRNKYFQDSQSDLARAEEDLASVLQTMAQRKDSLDHTELHAPMAGIVKNVRFTTVGAVIKPSEELLEIVPANDELVVEVRVHPQDVAHLKPGLPANIKIDAYDYTIYGSLNGTLTYLSPDTLSEDMKPNEQPYYRAKITAGSHRFSSRPDMEIDIQPGMTATVEIKTGQNTVLRYLTKPVLKTVYESMHEK